jgi:hypothetical protein
VEGILCEQVFVSARTPANGGKRSPRWTLT